MRVPKMLRKSWLSWLPSCMAVALLGCGVETTAPKAQAPQTANPHAPQTAPGPAGGMLGGIPGAPVVSPDATQLNAPAAVETTAPVATPEATVLPTPDASAVKADVGVGKAGSSLKNETGILVEPAKSLFATRERVVFQFAIPQAMQLFQATEGRLPNSHQEFMDKIVAANNIKLPALPAGREYFFDPQKGELMVRGATP